MLQLVLYYPATFCVFTLVNNMADGVWCYSSHPLMDYQFWGEKGSNLPTHVMPYMYKPDEIIGHTSPIPSCNQLWVVRLVMKFNHTGGSLSCQKHKTFKIRPDWGMPFNHLHLSMNAQDSTVIWHPAIRSSWPEEALLIIVNQTVANEN